MVENRPHPRIVEEHFNDAHLDDLQAGLIFEESGKIYPVFHSYTLTSQERKRDALVALERYYMRPIEEELDYDEAMRRLDVERQSDIQREASIVEYVDHSVSQDYGYNEKAHALIYDPNSAHI